MIYHPTGDDPVAASYLLTELATNVLAALLGVLVLSWLPSFGKRVFAAFLFGAVGWISIGASNWNWYGFPANYEIAELADQSVGWLLSGVAMAFILRKPSEVT